MTVEVAWAEPAMGEKMVDRRAMVTPLEGGRFEIEGVAYVAGVPNVNGMTYTKAALEEAFPRFMNVDFRPVTIGIDAEPKLSTCVGEVIGWSSDGDVFRVKVKTLPLEGVSSWVKAAAGDVALAGACQVSAVMGSVEDMTVRSIKDIISFGIVTVDEVMPKVEVYFFGAWGEYGHYYYLPGRQKPTGPLFPPWGAYGEDIDGKLQPRIGLTSKEAPQGVAKLHKQKAKDGVTWTALCFWDCTGDERRGSNSNFVARGDFSFEEMIALARDNFPEVMKRLDDAGIEIRKA